MEITLKVNKDFERYLNELQNKYGEDFEILNGIHSSQTNYSDFIDAFIDKNIADVSIDANANASNKDICSLLTEKSKSHDKIFALNKIFFEMKKKYGLRTAKDWLEQEYNGGFYLHDASSATYKAYCFAYDVSRLAKEGLFFLKNYNAIAPKHLSTFIDDVIEYISFMSNRSSGAVGLPNVLVWMFYFWNVDKKNGYYSDSERFLRQNFQKFIYRLNQPFMRIDQTAFVNVSIMDRNYVEALFGGLEFPDGSLFIDMEDEFMEFQKKFMEVVSDIRHENAFTFPVLTYCLLHVDGKFVDEEFAKWASNHNILWNDSNFFISKDVTTLSNCCFDGDQEFYYFDQNGNKILTTFKDYVESKLKINNDNIQTTEKLDVENYIIDPNTGNKAQIKAVSKLPNKFNKIIEIELENGQILKVTPDQKLFDKKSQQLVCASEILKNPNDFDI